MSTDAVCGTSPTAANTDDVMDDGAAPADAAAADDDDDDDDAGGDVGRTRAACVICETRVCMQGTLHTCAAAASAADPLRWRLTGLGLGGPRGGIFL